MMQIEKNALKKYSVCTSGLTDSVALTATEAIKKYVYAVTGVKLSDGESERKILLKADENLDSPHVDGFIIDTDGNDVTITGKTQRAVVYAAFAFAEECLGVKFLTADCEIVPVKDCITVKKYVYEPLFEMRTYLVGDTFQESADQDFMSKVRVKDVYTVPDDAHGGKIEVYGRNVSHNFHFYVPYEKYGKTHPEFYRHIVVNDKEMTTVDITNGLNEDGSLNESMSESVAKSVIDEMYKDVEAHPEVITFMLTQEDGPEYFDDENNRRLEAKYKRSGLLVRFCNAIIRAVNERAKKNLGRTVKLMTFAYDYAKEAPVKTENGKIVPIDDSVIADENLIIQFALFSNALYSYFDVRQTDVVRITSEWRVVAKDFWFWAYDIAFNNFFGYYDSFKNIDDNVKNFREYGITYLCVQGSNDSCKSWQCNMRAYAYRQIMNGNKLSANRLIDEYIDGYYSVAADSVKEFMRIFSDNYVQKAAEGNEIGFSTFGNFTNGENNPYDMLEKAVKTLEDGEAKIKARFVGEEREKYLKRIAGIKVTPLDLIYLNYYYYFPEGNETDRLAMRAEFVATARYAEIDRAREDYSLDRYVAFTETEVKIPDEYQVKKDVG